MPISKISYPDTVEEDLQAVLSRCYTLLSDYLLECTLFYNSVISLYRVLLVDLDLSLSSVRSRLVNCLYSQLKNVLLIVVNPGLLVNPGLSCARGLGRKLQSYV